MNDTFSRPSAADAPANAVDHPDGPNVLAAIVIATTAAFAGGGLVAQTVVVPQWRAMNPSAFLEHFATSGPTLGFTLFPLEVVSALALAATGYRAFRHRRPGRVLWSVATVCMVGTFVLLPVYFAGANGAMLSEGFPVGNVPGELAAWYGWNWVRTGLGLVATVVACLAIPSVANQRAARRILQRTKAV